MASKWTVERLERACRDALLQRSTVRIKTLPISRSADCEWDEPNGQVKVRVDNHQVGVLPAVLHELVHVVLQAELERFDEDLGECLVVALENRLNSRIGLSRRRLEWWRKAIKEATR